MRLHTAFLGLLLLTSTAYADPAWWETRGVISTAPAANLAPANIGQAKHMAAMALAKLQERLPAASHQALQADVALIVNLSLPDPLPPGYYETQRAVLLNGQLKAIAKPFYDHLRTHDATWLDNAMTAGNLVVMEPGSNPPTPSPYPWSKATTDDANRAPATLGQLKAVFSLPLETVPSMDLDSDGDGVTDSEEYAYGTDPINPTTVSGIPDLWLVLNFGESLLNSGLAMFNPNADPDGDGISTVEELQSGTNPNSADAAGSRQWVTVHGDGAALEEITRTGTLTIPAGQSAILVVAIASEEFPYYTGDQSEFNDLLEWHATPSQGTSIDGSINVNERHLGWEMDVVDGTKLPGLPNPVHIEHVRFLTALPNSDLTIQVEVSATNFSDGQLPSMVSVGLLPVKIVVHKKDEATPEDGVLVKKDDTVVYEIPWLPESVLVHFEKRLLEGNGQYGHWWNISIGTNVGKSKIEVKESIASIFQVRAVIAISERPSIYVNYTRKRDDPHGKSSSGVMNPMLKAGEPDFVGIAEGDTQIAIVKEARKNLGSTGWALTSTVTVSPTATAGPGDNKCNIFVYQTCVNAGLSVPLDSSGWPPRAYDWFDDTFTISGWNLRTSWWHPAPGQVVSRYALDWVPIIDRIPGTSAHVGIVDYNGAWINAGPGNINRYPHISNGDYQTAHYRQN